MTYDENILMAVARAIAASQEDADRAEEAFVEALDAQGLVIVAKEDA